MQDKSAEFLGTGGKLYVPTRDGTLHVLGTEGSHTHADLGGTTVRVALFALHAEHLGTDLGADFTADTAVGVDRGSAEVADTRYNARVRATGR